MWMLNANANSLESSMCSFTQRDWHQNLTVAGAGMFWVQTRGREETGFPPAVPAGAPVQKWTDWPGQGHNMPACWQYTTSGLHTGWRYMVIFCHTRWYTCPKSGSMPFDNLSKFTYWHTWRTRVKVVSANSYLQYTKSVKYICGIKVLLFFWM